MDAQNTLKEPAQEPPKKKHAGGRPRKWTRIKAMGIIDDIWEWLCAPPKITAAANEKMVRADYNITLEMFFVEKGLHPHLLWVLSKRFEEFRTAVQEIKEFQSMKINDLALKGELSGRYAQFYQSAQHGWAAQSKVENSGTVKLQGAEGGINITYEVVAGPSGGSAKTEESK